MSRGARITRNIVVGLIVLVVGVMLTALIVVRTDWFRNYVREQIVSAVEDSTGGRVELGSFNFDEGRLHASIGNLVIHGYEPATAAPFVRVQQVVADLRLFTRLNRIVDIANLGVQKPEVNIMILPDGRSNVPSPKTSSPSGKPPLKTVVDLAIGHFELSNGVATFVRQTVPFSLNANNLRAQLFYSLTTNTYHGDISLAPVYVVSGRSTPVVISLKLPLTIGSDRVELHQATLSTNASKISLDGSITHIDAPEVSARVNGDIALEELKTIGDIPVALNAPGVPQRIHLAGDFTASNEAIHVTNLQTTLGASSVEASGTLKDPHQGGALAFRSTLDLAELGKLLNVTEMRAGTMDLNGDARLTADNGYSVTGALQGKNIAIEQGTTRLRNLNISSSVSATQSLVELRNLAVTALGGRFEGSASLDHMQHYKVNGDLRAFDIQTALNTVGQKLPYDGIVSGNIAAEGDTSLPNSLAASGRLSVSPGKHGVPVTGKVNADYSAAANDVTLHNSFLALPHTRLDMDGSLSRTLQVKAKTQDLNDVLVAAGVSGQTVSLNRGEVTFAGAVTGGLHSPRINGHLASERLVVEGRQFDSLAADLAASGAGAAVSNGVLVRAGSGPGLHAQFAGSVGLADWKLLPREPVKADLSITDGDLADLAALAGQPSADYSGAVTAMAHIDGTAGNPVGAVTLNAATGAINGLSFDKAQVQANLTDRLVTIPASFVQSGSGRLDLSGEFRHPEDSFSTGQIHAKVVSNQIDLASTVGRFRQNVSGTVSTNLDVAGELKTDEFILTSVNGSATARAVKWNGQPYGDLDASARTTGQTVNYTATSNFAGSSIHANGNTQLVHDYPTTADLVIANLPIDKTLAVAGNADIPARGNLAGNLRLTGTVSDPHGEGSLDLTRAVLYDEPIDRLHVRAAWLARAVDVPEFQITAGNSQIELTAHYDHPAGSLTSGSAKFNVTSSRLDLARIHNVQSRRLGLAGAVQLEAHGEGSVVNGTGNSQPRITLRDLNVNVAASQVRDQGENFGNLKLTANTTSGDRVEFALDSDLADAAIHGKGSAQLVDGYPVNAQLTFNNLLYSRVAKLAGIAQEGQSQVEAATDGQITVNGPILRTDQLKASLQVSRLNITAKARPGDTKPVSISNQGPIALTLDRGSAQIQNAHLAGSGVDIQATGGATLPAGTLNLNLNAKLNLGILPDFDSDIYSSGDLNLTATVRGTQAQPQINGRFALQNATFNYAGLPNGISNANGLVILSGKTATIQNLSGESGGGKITVTGFAEYADLSRFGIQVKATRVRARLQPGVSVVAGADLQLSGTSRRSTLSGTAVIGQVNYNPQTDMASILSQAEPSVQSETAPSPLLENMRLDIRLRTASGLAVQADVAQGISATADIHVQGTAAKPAALGRVTINEGKLVFLGSSFTVQAGTIGFFNPLQIDPVLDVSLETQTQGIDVTLRVTGPIYNMKLSYTSNPPLRFQEIVSLLATGKGPTSDPTLLANQPQVPQSSLQQMGESAALGQAVANPVAGRLQRVFGVSQLKIDPSFQSGSSLPTARLTLQQHITHNMTFTYTSALDDPNGQIIKVEWAFDPKWSAIATRDQNGIFSVNFFYKRQFR